MTQFQFLILCMLGHRDIYCKWNLAIVKVFSHNCACCDNWQVPWKNIISKSRFVVCTEFHCSLENLSAEKGNWKHFYSLLKNRSVLSASLSLLNGMEGSVAKQKGRKTKGCSKYRGIVQYPARKGWQAQLLLSINSVSIKTTAINHPLACVIDHINARFYWRVTKSSACRSYDQFHMMINTTSVSKPMCLLQVEHRSERELHPSTK